MSTFVHVLILTLSPRLGFIDLTNDRIPLTTVEVIIALVIIIIVIVIIVITITER